MTEPDTPPPDAPVDALPAVKCWRCGLEAPGGGAPCPHCGAQLAPREGSSRRTMPLSDDARQLRALLVWFAILLGTGIVHSVVLESRFGDKKIITAQMEGQVLQQVAVVEAIDTIVVVAAIGSMWQLMPQSRPREVRRLAPWLAALPILACLLAINFTYNTFLREILGLPMIENEMLDTRGWLTIVTVCVQPAIIEEAFCRGLAIGVLRNVGGIHSAVWISATMFALMHVAVILSMPYLFLVGLVLGYFRVTSGTIWLPIAVHFLHNLGVLWYEWR